MMPSSPYITDPLADASVLQKSANLSDLPNPAAARANLGIDGLFSINVLDWEARGDGVTDDTTAIQNAADAATAINGRLVFPHGHTFMVNPAVNDGNNMIIGLNGACEVWIEKGATVKVMASATAYGGVFGNNGVNNDMTGVQFGGGGTIDGNKATRVAAGVVPDATHWCGAISLGIGSHQKVLDLRFTNFDCVWVIAGSADNTGNASDCEVAHCQFDNLGNTIPAQKHDCSVIYLDAIGMSVHHNTFWQGKPGGQSSLLGGSAPAFVANYGVRTAIECHGTSQHVHHNRTFGMQWGGQLQASSVSWLNQDVRGSYNSVGINWHDNHFLHCAVGIQIGPYGLTGGNYYGLDSVEIHDNTISVNPAIWNVDTGGGLLLNGIVLPSSAQTGSVSRLGIHDNKLGITPNNSALNSFAFSGGTSSNPSMIALQMVGTNVIQDWTISDNKFFGALYHGILVTATDITGLKIVGNTIRDIGLYPSSFSFAIVVESSGGLILDSDITNNTVIDDQTAGNHPWGWTTHTINGTIIFSSGATLPNSYRISENYGRCADGTGLTQTAGWSGSPAPFVEPQGSAVVTDSSAVANSPIVAAAGNRQRSLRDWVSLKDFGGVGDGAHTAADTLAFQEAMMALPAGGCLIVPQGFWTLNAAITISKPITILGTGYGASGVNQGCQVVQTVDATDAFVITSDYVTLSGFTLTTNFTATSGAGIHQTSGAFTIIERMAVSAFVNNVQFDRSQGAHINHNVFISPVHYNVYIRNTLSADTGDSELIGNYIGGGSTTPLAGLRYESSGGLRTIGNKIIQHQRGIDLQVPDGAVTGVFPIVGNSIENQSANCIRIARSGTTGTWRWVTLSGNQINGTQLSGSADVVQIGAGISEVAITGNVIEGTASTTGVHAATGSDGVAITGNNFGSHAVGIQRDGSNVSFKGNQYRSVTTRVAGAGSLATMDTMADEPVQAPSFSGTWSNFGAPYRNVGFYREGGRVYVEGVAKSTGTDNALFTLPAGYRPSSSEFWRCSSSSAGGEDVTIANTGAVSVGSGVAHSYLSLNGINFLAEA